MTDDTEEDPKGFAQMPRWLQRDETVSPWAKLVYLALASRVDRYGQCHPAYSQIAKEASCSVKTVKRALADLRTLGVVTWTGRALDNGSQTSNLYTVHNGARSDAQPAGTDPEQLFTDEDETALTRGSQGPRGQRDPHPQVSETSPQGHRDLDPGSVGPTNESQVNESQVNEGSADADPARRRATVPAAVPAKPRPKAITDLDPADAPEGTRFIDFWRVYPRHDDRRRAENAWKSARRRANPAEIVAGAARYRDDPNREQLFTKQPATWLNADAWANDPLPPRARPAENAVDRRNRQVEDMRARLAARTQPTPAEIGAGR